ncbi:hypothetical protein D3C81_1898120 [compost metagenome]
MHHLAVLAQVTVFKVEFGLAAHDFPRGIERALAIGRMHQIDHRLTDHLVGGVTENALESRTDKYEATLLVDRTNGVEQQIEVACQRCGVTVCHGALLWIQALFVTSPGNACARALMAKPMNITPHNRVIASSWR